MSAHKDLHI